MKLGSNEQASLYRPDNLDWPNVKHLKISYPMCKSGRELDWVFRRFDAPTITHNETLNKNFRIIKKIELIFYNYHLNYESEYWQTIITQLHEYLEPHSFIKEYRELFRRKFDLKYRKENQVIYTEKILEKTAVGECAKKITSFL
jgi:hypothetical protein